MSKWLIIILNVVVIFSVGCISLPKKPDTRQTVLNVYTDKDGNLRAYGDSKFKGQRKRINIKEMDKNICTPYADAEKELSWMIKVMELIKSEIYK